VLGKYRQGELIVGSAPRREAAMAPLPGRVCMSFFAWKVAAPDL